MHDRADVGIIEDTMAALGLRTVFGPNAFAQYGYLGGTDDERAADVHWAFSNPEIDIILAFRGGWGCNRLLPMLDYDLIASNPKPLLGYSDITGLLIALYAKVGLVSFHTASGLSTWNTFTVDYIQRVLFDAEAVYFANPTDPGNRLARTKDRTVTLTPGTARGRLVGGNLTVLSAMVGSDYMPDWSGHILFLEDIGEAVYRVDRMLTQLRLAGILEQISGFVFGQCTNCDPDSGGYGSLTMDQVLDDHLKPYGIPAFRGAMIGHIADKFTVPVGIEAEMDADAGTITMLEAAVV
ncbi:MAG: LD-carboxypeptidase [Rhodothermales bacterium]